MFFTAFLLLAGFITKRKEVILSGMLIAILSGVAIIPMNLSGEGAEELVEHKPGVTHELIHEHGRSYLSDRALNIFGMSLN